MFEISYMCVGCQRGTAGFVTAVCLGGCNVGTDSAVLISSTMGDALQDMGCSETPHLALLRVPRGKIAGDRRELFLFLLE